MGLEGRPLFTRPLDLSRHLQRLRTYGEERWAQRQRSKQAQKKARRDRAQGAKPQRSLATPADRRRCPAKGGAKRSALHYGTDFYAKPTVPDGKRHPPFQVVDTGMGARSHIPYTLYHNTRAHGNTGRRHTSGGERRGCARHTDTHRAERARRPTGEYGTAVPEGTRGTRGCLRVPPCRGASPHPTAPPGGAQSQPEDSRSGGGGTTPSPQEARNAHAGEGGRAHTRGARRPEPASPPAHGDEATAGRDTSTAASTTSCENPNTHTTHGATWR